MLSKFKSVLMGMPLPTQQLAEKRLNKIRKEWNAWWPDVPLVILPSPYRSIVHPLLDYLDQTDLEHNDGTQAAVVLPEFIPARWWYTLLHIQSSMLIKAALLLRRCTPGYQRIVIDVPYRLKK